MTETGHEATAAATAERMSTMWARGWRRYVFPSFWLIYLTQAITGVNRHHSGAPAVIGYAIVGAFAAVYVMALVSGMQRQYDRFWWLYGVALALTTAATWFAHEDAFTFLVYVSVLTIATQRRGAVPVVVGYALVAAVVPAIVPSWHHGIAWDNGITLLLVSLAMFGFFKIMQANGELAAARAEVARLAAENERSRIARDLHDLLGHSLTTITVKAGLARRLSETGADERARSEIAEVEQLARRTLGDVRAAVSMHRDMTLAGELATAREVLRAAGIVAELPATVAEVDPDVDELFGWVVREGVTNAVRHSRATHLTIEVGRRTLAVSDDGVGGVPVPGNGLTGLRERIEAQDGRLELGRSGLGFGLRVEVPGGVPAPAQRVDAP